MTVLFFVPEAKSLRRADDLQLHKDNGLRFVNHILVGTIARKNKDGNECYDHMFLVYVFQEERVLQQDKLWNQPVDCRSSDLSALPHIKNDTGTTKENERIASPSPAQM